MALVTSLLYTTTVFYAIPVNFLTEWVTTSLEEVIPLGDHSPPAYHPCTRQPLLQ
eukprot:gene7649-9113_t